MLINHTTVCHSVNTLDMWALHSAKILSTLQQTTGLHQWIWHSVGRQQTYWHICGMYQKLSCICESYVTFLSMPSTLCKDVTLAPHAHTAIATDLQLHDVATSWSTNQPCSNAAIILVQWANVARVLVVIYHLHNHKHKPPNFNTTTCTEQSSLSLSYPWWDWSTQPTHLHPRGWRSTREDLGLFTLCNSVTFSW